MKAFKSNGITVNLITEDDVKPTGGGSSPGFKY